MVSVLLVVTLAIARPHAGRVSLPQYALAVHRVRLSLDRVARHPSQAGVEEVQRRLRSLRFVRIPNTRVITTDLPLLATQISAQDPASVARAAATIDALDASLRGASPSHANPATLKSLDAVMQDARFHPARPPWAPLTDWIARLRDRIVEWLANNLNGHPATSGGFGILFLVLVAGLAVLLARGALARMVVEAAQEEEEDTPRTSSVAADRSQAAGVAGDFREALRYLFLATMLALQESGALELRPGLTNREYIQVLRSHRPGDDLLRADLDELVDVFDAAWYGHLPFGAADYERARALSDKIVQSAGRRAA